MGSGAKATISWEVLRALPIITNSPPQRSHRMTGIDALFPDETSKEDCLRTGYLEVVGQAAQLRNPDARIILGETQEGELLSRYAKTYQGIKTGDDPRHKHFFWEVAKLNNRWRFCRSTVEKSKPFSVIF